MNRGSRNFVLKMHGLKVEFRALVDRTKLFMARCTFIITNYVFVFIYSHIHFYIIFVLLMLAYSISFWLQCSSRNLNEFYLYLFYLTLLYYSIPLLTVLPTIHYFVMDLKVAGLKKNHEITACQSGQGNDVKLQLKSKSCN